MSVSGILSSNLLNYNTLAIQDRMQQFRKDFQQLGQDLRTGNLSGAQADFAGCRTLNRSRPLLRRAAFRSHRRSRSSAPTYGQAT